MAAAEWRRGCALNEAPQIRVDAMTRRTRTAIAILTAVIAAVASASGVGWWAYDKHRSAEARAQILPLVKNTTLRLQDALSILVDAGSMSFAEGFRKLDDHVVEIDKRSLELRTLDTARHAEVAEAATLYMKNSQEVIRKQAAMYRKSLDVSSKMKWLTNRASSADTSSLFAINLSLKQIREARDDVHRAYTEFRTEATTFDVALEELLKIRETVAPHLERSILIDDDTIQKARKATGELKKLSAGHQREIEKLRVR